MDTYFSHLNGVDLVVEEDEAVGLDLVLVDEGEDGDALLVACVVQTLKSKQKQLT